MKNETLIKTEKQILKDLLSQLTEDEQLFFKKLYLKPDNKYLIRKYKIYKVFKTKELLNNLMNDIVEQMDIDKLDWAILQCERTIDKKKYKC